MNRIHVLFKYVLFYWIIIVSVTGFSACVYKEPPPSKINLVDHLVQSRTSLEYFSFDLNTSIMFPYLTEFGKYPLNSNIVTTGNNTVITIPLSPLRPTSLVLEVHAEELISGKAYLRIFLNNEDIGFIGVGKTGTRKRFVFDKHLWNPAISQISVRMPEGSGSVFVDNLWLLSDRKKDASALETGNIFTSLIAFPEEGMWNTGVYLAAHSSLTVPVQLPTEQVFFQCQTLSGSNTNLNIHIEFTSAGKFGRKNSISTDIRFRNADQWFPVKWDVSDLSGQYTALLVENRGDKSVLLRDFSISDF